MEIQTKKAIAREFLILILCFIITGLGYVGILVYNYYYNNKLHKITNEINSKSLIIEGLTKDYYLKGEKQKWVTEKFNNYFSDNYKEYSNKKVWNYLFEILREDEIEQMWSNDTDKKMVSFFKKLGFGTPQKLKSFIIENTPTKYDNFKIDSANKLKLSIDSLWVPFNNYSNKILSPRNQVKTVVIFFVITFFLFFIFRYLFLAIRQSLKILKQ